MLARLKRTLRHGWFELIHSDALSHDATDRLSNAVAQSELRHSGEIRVFIESTLPRPYLLQVGSLTDITRQRALDVFGQLRVWDTAHNNGVLVYLLLAERAVELVADRGLTRHITDKIWSDTVSQLTDNVRRSGIEAGLLQAVDAVSELLQQHFSLAAGDVNPNELPNAPVLGSTNNKALIRADQGFVAN